MHGAEEGPLRSENLPPCFGLPGRNPSDYVGAGIRAFGTQTRKAEQGHQQADGQHVAEEVARAAALPLRARGGITTNAFSGRFSTVAVGVAGGVGKTLGRAILSGNVLVFLVFGDTVAVQIAWTGVRFDDALGVGI